MMPDYPLGDPQTGTSVQPTSEFLGSFGHLGPMGPTLTLSGLSPLSSCFTAQWPLEEGCVSKAMFQITSNLVA